MDFDVERFIIEVQNRPAIWNTDYYDKKLRQKAWDELVDIYGADLSEENRKQMNLDLQKKWRNVRDAFVKAHNRVKNSKSRFRKKTPYLYYDNLFFLKDTLTGKKCRPIKIKKDVNTDSEEETDSPEEDNRPTDTASPPMSKKIKKEDNFIFAPEVECQLNENLERNDLKCDEDRLFFLSLVKDFKKIPEHMQLQAKVDILNVIKEAQQCEYLVPS